MKHIVWILKSFVIILVVSIIIQRLYELKIIAGNNGLIKTVISLWTEVSNMKSQNVEFDENLYKQLKENNQNTKVNEANQKSNLINKENNIKSNDDISKKEEFQSDVNTNNLPEKIILENVANERELSKNESPVYGKIEKLLLKFLSTEQGIKFLEEKINLENKFLLPNGQTFPSNNLFSINRIYNISHNSINRDEAKKILCGDKIKILYKIENSNENSEKTEEYILGKHEIKELNIFPLNRTKGSLITGNMKSRKKSKIQINIEDFENNDPDLSNIKIFDDTISSTMPVVCGDKIQFKMDVFSVINGQEIMFSKDIVYDTLDSAMPYIYKYISNSMPYMGKRTVLLPAEYLLTPKELEDYGLKNKSQILMLEIHDVYKIPQN